MSTAHDPFRGYEPQVSQGDDDLEKLKKDELIARAEKAGLDTAGTKADLIERIRAG